MNNVKDFLIFQSLFSGDATDFISTDGKKPEVEIVGFDMQSISKIDKKFGNFNASSVGSMLKFSFDEERYFLVSFNVGGQSDCTVLVKDGSSVIVKNFMFEGDPDMPPYTTACVGGMSSKLIFLKTQVFMIINWVLSTLRDWGINAPAPSHIVTVSCKDVDGGHKEYPVYTRQ